MGRTCLKVFGSRVLRKTFRQKKDEIIGDWKRFSNGELMTCSPSLWKM
jgi:hypothetical protein